MRLVKHLMVVLAVASVAVFSVGCGDGKGNMTLDDARMALELGGASVNEWQGIHMTLNMDMKVLGEKINIMNTDLKIKGNTLDDFEGISVTSSEIYESSDATVMYYKHGIVYEIYQGAGNWDEFSQYDIDGMNDEAYGDINIDPEEFNSTFKKANKTESKDGTYKIVLTMNLQSAVADALDEMPDGAKFSGSATTTYFFNAEDEITKIEIKMNFKMKYQGYTFTYTALSNIVEFTGDIAEPSDFIDAFGGRKCACCAG